MLATTAELELIRRSRREVNTLKEKLALTSLVDELFHFPSFIFFSFSDVCNLKCRFCGRESMHHKKDGIFTMEMFGQVAPYLHLVNFVAFTGHGEPTMHPRFFDVAETCKRAGARVHLTTNGTLLDDRRINHLLDMGLDEMIVSLDGTTEETTADLRAGFQLAPILSNVERLIAERNRRGLSAPQVDMHMVVSRNNMHQMPDMVRLCRRLTLRELKIFNMIAHKPEFLSESVCHTWRFKYYMFRARRLAKRLGVAFQYLYNQPDPRRQSRVINRKDDGVRRYCTFPWQMPFLYKEGDVRPCCVSDFVLGDLHHETLWQVMHGETARNLRRSFITGDYVFDCARCGLIKTLDWEYVRRTLDEVEREIAAGDWTADERAELTHLLQLHQVEYERQRP